MQTNSLPSAANDRLRGLAAALKEIARLIEAAQSRLEEDDVGVAKSLLAAALKEARQQ